MIKLLPITDSLSYSMVVVLLDLLEGLQRLFPWSSQVCAQTLSPWQYVMGFYVDSDSEWYICH